MARGLGWFVLRRLVALVVTLLVSSVLIYGALYISPGDPAALLAGGQHPSPATLNAIRNEYHLNDPFLEQYWHWFSGVLKGRLGKSIGFQTQVSGLLSARVSNTLFLVAYAGALILLLGVGHRRGVRSTRSYGQDVQHRNHHGADGGSDVRLLDRAHLVVRHQAELVPSVRLRLRLRRQAEAPHPAGRRTRLLLPRLRQPGDPHRSDRRVRLRAR